MVHDRGSAMASEVTIIGISKKVKYCLIAALIGILALYASFYTQIHSAFTIIDGDQFDGVIQAVLISHWWEVLHGHQNWSAPLYFYPYHDVLGYNDTFFIYGLIAAIYRAFDANILVANVLSLITIRAIGFFSMALFLRFLGRRFLDSLLGAALFTMWLALSVQSGHGQLLAVYFAPLMAYFLLKSKREFEQKRQGAAIGFLSVFILLYAALLFSCFYMAWFFGLFLFY
jgi:hypothetical protein